MSLVPCGGCGRHVMNAETACPFCGASIDPSVPVPGTPKRRLNRAATFAFGAAVAAATATGCGESHTGTDAGDDVTEDAGVEEEEDAGGVAPPYGAPAEDAGSVVAAYGAPADAGFAPLYGGAPGD